MKTLSRIVLGLLLLAFAPVAADAAVAVVQTGNRVAAVSGTPITLTLSSSPSSSNQVWLFVYNDATSDGGNSSSNTSASISTPAGFTAGPTTTYSPGSNPGVVAAFWRTGTTSTSFNVTFACSSGCNAGGYAMEVSGADNTTPVDSSAFNNNGTTGYTTGTVTWSGPNVTPSQSGELVIGAFWLNDDTEYGGVDYTAGTQQTSWTENVVPYTNATNCFCYPSFEGQYITNPSSGVAIHPKVNQFTCNDNCGPNSNISIGMAIVIKPASAVASACLPPPWIGAYGYGSDWKEPPWIGAIIRHGQ